MKKHLVLLVLIFASSLSWGVSFDCKRFNTGIYKIICESPELSRLDDELSEQYIMFNDFFKEFGGGNERVGFRNFVKEMLERRNECSTESCLLNWYKTSLQAYEEIKRSVAIHLSQR